MPKQNRWSRDGDMSGWYKPRQNLQRTLFPEERDEFLARVYARLDELERWREKGWLSFDARAMTELDEPETSEILFVRSVSESGLPDAIITRMLSELPKPYSYDKVGIAYSFAYGWVALPPFDDEDVDAFMTNFLEEWTESKLKKGDTKLLDIVYNAVFRHRIESFKKEAESDE